MKKGQAKFLDYLERAGWTAGQQFFAVLLATSATASSVVSLPWKVASIAAISAAILSLLGTAVQYLGDWHPSDFWPDLLVRLAKTFLASFLGTVGANALDIFTADWSSALNLAAIATLGALAKGLLARQPEPGADNPSTLPPRVYRYAMSAEPALGTR